MGFCGCPLMLDERIYLLAEGVVLFWADVKVPEMLYENFSRKVQSPTTQAAFGRRSGPKTLLNSFVPLEISAGEFEFSGYGSAD